MAKVFDCSTDIISLHLKHIFKSDELDEKSVTEESSVTANDGKKYKTKIYNLDAIIAVGYRVNSKKATEFRIGATKILKMFLKSLCTQYCNITIIKSMKNMPENVV